MSLDAPAVPRSVAIGSAILAAGSLGMLAATFAILARHPDVTTATGRHLWAGALAIAVVALEELLLALVPLRRGERWALWAAAIPFLLLGLPILVLDAVHVSEPRRFATLAPQVAGMLVGATGLGLCAYGILGRASRPVRA